jgi:hypothetical protein
MGMHISTKNAHLLYLIMLANIFWGLFSNRGIQNSPMNLNYSSNVLDEKYFLKKTKIIEKCLTSSQFSKYGL